MLPITRTEPLCFSHVDGCRKAGSAKMGVGDEAVSCELKASLEWTDKRYTVPYRKLLASVGSKPRPIRNEKRGIISRYNPPREGYITPSLRCNTFTQAIGFLSHRVVESEDQDHWS